MKCKETKRLSEFSKFAKGRDGLRSQCTECDKKYQREYRERKRKMPSEKEAYQLTSRTMRDHFYIHFGFTDSLTQNWRVEYKKYHQKPLIDKYNEIKKNK